MFIWTTSLNCEFVYVAFGGIIEVVFPLQRAWQIFVFPPVEPERGTWQSVHVLYGPYGKYEFTG